MIIRYPVSQAIKYIVSDYGVVAVKRIAAATEIVIIAIRREQIIGLIIYSSIGDIRSIFITLCSMIKYNIEYYLYTGLMHLLDHIFKLFGHKSH